MKEEKSESIGKEMFTQIRTLFPYGDYLREDYKKYWQEPKVDELLYLGYYQLALSISSLLSDYGWTFRESFNPETGQEFHKLEQIENSVYGEFIKFFDFYFSYRKYSSKYKEMSFTEYLTHQTNF